MEGETDRAGRWRLPPWTGAASLLLWLACMASAWGHLLVPAKAVDMDADALLERIGAVVDFGTLPAGAVALRLPASGCACGGDASGEWPRLAAELRRLPLVLVDLSASPGAALASHPFPLVVVDTRHRRLLYAGPLRLENLCGGGSPSASSVLQTLLSHPQPPLIANADCPCE